MKNVYIIIKNGINNVNLIESISKGSTNHINACDNFHYKTVGDVSIFNGLLDDDTIEWFESQEWAYYVGDHYNGRAENIVLRHGYEFNKPKKFMRAVNGQFKIGHKRHRSIGVNKYNLSVSSLPQASVSNYFQACKERKITVVRTWCFDAGSPPTDSGGNFRFINYLPDFENNKILNHDLETNSSGWTFHNQFTLSTQQAYIGTQSIKQISNGGYNSAYYIAEGLTQNTTYTLTFWYYQVSRSGFGPVVRIRKGSDDAQILDGGLLEGSVANWTRKQIHFNSGAETSVKVQLQNWNGFVTFHYDYFCLNVRGAPFLDVRESQFRHLDMMLDEAAKNNVKLILSLADNNPNFDTKRTYVTWANTLFNAGYSNNIPHVQFFLGQYCKQLFKDFIDLLVNRVNTINGKTYKDDEAIFSWELGNELRVDRNDPSGQNTINGANLSILSKPGGWTDEMSTYIKSVDTNHMVAFGDAAHTWQWVSGDNISNGTYYGVDYEMISKLPNIDYVDYHYYPTQGGGEVQVTKKYGQRLGYPNTVNRVGFEAQMRDFVRVAKRHGKPVMISEVGFIREVTGSNTIIPLYPRRDTFEYLSNLHFDADGDVFLIWNGEINDGGSYTVNISGTWNGNTTNLNFDDRPVCELIESKNSSF